MTIYQHQQLDAVARDAVRYVLYDGFHVVLLHGDRAGYIPPYPRVTEWHGGEQQSPGLFRDQPRYSLSEHDVHA